MERPELNRVYCGDILSVLRSWPNSFVDCCITSPPYWRLRTFHLDPVVWDGDPGCRHRFSLKTVGGDFHYRGDKAKARVNKHRSLYQKGSGTGCFCCRCGAWRGELGQEPTIALYVKHLCDVFTEIHRVLVPGGSCFVNIGDSYWNAKGSAINPGGGVKSWDAYDNKKLAKAYPSMRGARSNMPDYPLKSMCFIPARFAIEMANRGWSCRNRIIWFKINGVCSSQPDRLFHNQEDIYHFTKSQRYYYNRVSFDIRQGHKMGSVWPVSTNRLKNDHYAVFPEEIPRRCLILGCKPGGIVLDPFIGIGTTGVAAKRLNMNWLGVDLSKKFADQATVRISNTVVQGVI